MLMKDRIALVTGASRGIGAATAKLLARHGAAVGVNYYSNPAAAQEVVKAIEAEGGKAFAVKANVTNNDEVKAMVQQVTEALGAIDTLILNAAGPFPIAPFLEYKWEDFEHKVLSELKSTFFPCQAVIPSMIEQKKVALLL